MATSRIGQAVLFWMRWLLLLQMHQGLDPKAQKIIFSILSAPNTPKWYILVLLLTHLVVNTVMIPCKWVKCAQLHPSLAHVSFSVTNKSTDIRASERDTKLIEL